MVFCRIHNYSVFLSNQQNLTEKFLIGCMFPNQFGVYLQYFCRCAAPHAAKKAEYHSQESPIEETIGKSGPINLGQTAAVIQK